MAHPALHGGLGMWAGMLAAAPLLFPGRTPVRRRAAAAGLWLIAAYAAGLWAIIPNLLSLAGLPEAWTASAWMNIFFFHTWLSAHKTGGALIGQLACGAAVAVQYGVLLLMLYTLKHADRKTP